MAFHYCYLTLNKKSGKIYIGSHSSQNKFDKKYIGTGLLIRRAIKKYGKDNFICIPLSYFNSREEAYIGEEKYISLFESIHPNGYNISPNGGVFAPNFFNEETKQKFSKLYKDITWEEKFGEEEAKRRKEEYKKQRSGKTIIEILGEEGAKKRVEKFRKSMKGKKPTALTREKISNKLKGQIPWNKGLSLKQK
ncbi:MAG TPA: GIY-YIG nuclease family protein [Candidatus Paceibacterota bacterium]|nr:GIY-YIG nuclease family protein [Candidatus Paceibacterota bacterium]